MCTWIGHHNDDAVGAILDDLGDDVLEDVDVPLHQVQAALALLLAHAGGDHHHTGVGSHGVVWGPKEAESDPRPQAVLCVFKLYIESYISY